MIAMTDAKTNKAELLKYFIEPVKTQRIAPTRRYPTRRRYHYRRRAVLPQHENLIVVFVFSNSSASISYVFCVFFFATANAPSATFCLGICD